ncbi:MAG: penicillin acylase family protein [Pseudomonadota bacterium]
MAKTATTSELPPAKPKRKRRWIWRTLLAVLILILVILVAGFFWQRTSLPEIEGSLTVPGLGAETRISRSPEGLTFIQAESEADALYALGFAHAQDRLFQMDAMRRLAAGRLSEVIGDATLDVDRFFRTLGLYRQAEENLEGLSPEVIAGLEAYAAGVNAFLESHEGALPIGFTALQFRPEPWRPADSVAWGRLMALFLSGNHRQELINARLATLLPEEKLAQLFPDWPSWAPTSVPSLQGFEQRGQLKDLIDLLPWEIQPKTASNAWAVAPSRSASGAAIMAGDPHLALRAPGDWYLVRMETPELTLAGGTAPGVPLMIFGHNQRLAWTFTTTYSDTQDLFIEEIDPDNPDRYRTPDGWADFEIREEVIEVSGAAPEILIVRETRHGPVISDVVDEAEGLYPPEEVLALAWTALDPNDRSAQGLYRLNRAANIPGALSALRDLHSPQQTMILADNRGSIALVAPGRVPIRKAGNGLFPVPGADGEHDWVGEIPYDALPREINPESGVLITANNKLVGDDYPYLIAADWSYPDRAVRIAEVLETKDLWSAEDFRLLQLDDLSVGARRLMGRLLQAELPSEASAAVQRLSAWDFRMDRDSAEPLIYSTWLRALEQLLMRDELGDAFESMADGDAWRVYSLLQPGSHWCDDVSTEGESESCDAIIVAGLEQALAELVDLYGDDVSEWRWGRAHYASFGHPVLTFIPVISGLTAVEVETPGGQDTVNRAGSDFARPLPEAFRDRHGPGFRGVFDMGDPDGAGVVIATGNSGNIFSPYYVNLAEQWRDGVLFTLPPNPPSGSQTLTLQPQR